MPKHSWSFEAIGTQWVIDTPHLLSREIKQGIETIIEEFDKTYSRFRRDSLISQVAAKSGTYEFPDSAKKLVAFYREIYEATDGAVSPLVGQILSDAGYDRDYSLRPGQTTHAPQWDDVMDWQGTQLTATTPVLIDFGAAGKGYLVDIISKFLNDAGHEEYTIDGSGDIRVSGRKETIGLESPFDSSMAIGSVTVENASLCASAVNRRAWGDWHHIVDPRTGKPTRDVIATWVVAPTTLEADGLSTALFFVGPEKLSNYECAYVRIFADGHIEHSANFVGQLFTE